MTPLRLPDIVKARMADVFISYARPDEAKAIAVADALRAAGYEVWRDDELPAHGAYADVIQERLSTAKAAVVLWSSNSMASQWVRAEADEARNRKTLVQATLDGSLPPIPFTQIHCAELSGWTGDLRAPGWRKLLASVTTLAGSPDRKETPRAARQKLSVCVLPFHNMSGEAEQEYFSDGIAEDITTDLSKVSAVAVTARNTAFTFKGSAVDVPEVARKLGVTHVLEGSVRKAGGRVRVTAQLIDGKTGDHLWAERYDRDLTDIFAIQDEISQAIVSALKLKLLPAEKEAIENRGTANADAYNVYLLGRHQWIAGPQGNPRREEAIVRLCEQALGIDQEYADAWALMALAQAELRFWHGRDEDALSAAERAIEINPQLAEAYCVKGRYLEEAGRSDEAEAQVHKALELDADSWEVNREAARMLFRHGHIAESVPYFRKAAELMDTDWNSPSMLISCFSGLGDSAELRSAAQLAIERVERATAHDATNGSALGAGAAALALLGQDERAREWSRRALMLDPDNLHMRYNIACALMSLGDTEEAIEALQSWFQKVGSTTRIRHALTDPYLDPVRDDPRFKAMMADAQERLGLNAHQKC